MVDLIDMFLKEECIIDYSIRGTLATDLYQEYCNWCKQNDFYVETNSAFGRKAGKAYARKHATDGNLYMHLQVRSKR